MKTETFPSKAGLKTAGSWFLCALFLAPFAAITLTVSLTAYLAFLAAVLVAAAGYLAVWVARGRTDGR